MHSYCQKMHRCKFDHAQYTYWVTFKYVTHFTEIPRIQEAKKIDKYSQSLNR